MKNFKIAFIILFLTFSQTIFSQNNTVIPIELKCDFWENPEGIDVERPVFSWTIKMRTKDRRGMSQTAYQIIVSSTLKGLYNDIGDIWNSEKIMSDKMAQEFFDGNPLLSSKKYWWKVKIWDENNKESDWSEPANWTMGVLNKSDWKTDWISAEGAEKYAPKVVMPRTDFSVSRRSPDVWADMPKSDDLNFSSMLLRKEFNLEHDLRRAVVHVSGLGQYEMMINGKKVGDYLLTPGWSDYKKTFLYDTYDVTNLLKNGNNAIGLILSNGMYNIQPDSLRYVKFLNTYGQLKAIVQLHLEYADGSVKTLGTDSTWQTAPGPITYMNQYGGEDFDARLFQDGWDKISFSPDSSWSRAIKLSNKEQELKGLSSSAPPIKAIEELKPIKKSMLKSNLWVYDLGQNASIMPKIRVKGPIGSSIRIIPAELLKSDGTVDRSSATQDGVRPAWWQFTKSSDKIEAWFPKFFYQGARYLQVELFPAQGENILPVIEELKGVVIHSSAEPIGTFSCSNELFNQIYELVRWAQRSNFVSVLTDCPQREKLPWLEQYHLNGPSLRYNFDMLTLFSKAMNDMSDSQLESGFVPNIAPELFHAGEKIEKNGFRNSPEWGSSFIIVPWQQYLFSGDVTLMGRYYDKMKSYLVFLDNMAINNILDVGLGDWYDIGPKEPWGSQLTPVAFTATAIYYYDYKLMAKMAGILGKSGDADKFEIKSKAIKEQFNKSFYKPNQKNYATGSNTCLAMPLFLELTETQNRQSLIDTLISDIRKKNNSFTSGDVGYRYLLKALAMEGRSDIIFDMNNQTDKPGYGYQLKMGATSLTEKWDAGVGSFGSQNHFMLGQINEWFFHDLVGIGWDEKGPGFRKSIIAPSFVGDIEWVKGSYKTVSGMISVEWRKYNSKINIDIIIPANTMSTVYIPTQNEKSVSENGNRASKSKGITFIKYEKGKAIYEVESGFYSFIVN
jgi:hypothetical protein